MEQVVERIQENLCLAPVFTDSHQMSYAAYWISHTSVNAFLDVIRPFCFNAIQLHPRQLLNWLRCHQIVQLQEIDQVRFVTFNQEHPFLSINCASKIFPTETEKVV